MDVDGNYSDGDDDDEYSLTLDRRLPVVIPLPKPAKGTPVWRLVVSCLKLIAVAVIASGAGVLGAALWPYHTKFNNAFVTSLPVSKDTPHTADSAEHSSSATIRLNRPAAMIASDTCQLRTSAPQLVVSGPTVMLRPNQPALLGMRVDGAPDGAQLVICGFASRSIISAGQSIDDRTWALPVSDLPDAVLIPPAGFIGQMKLDVVLVNLDKSIADHKTLLMQWDREDPGQTSMPLALEVGGAAQNEIDRQLEEGRHLEATGNLPLARGIFLRFAQGGNARAAYLLANSYDPISLAKRLLLPPESDLALARIWYRKASDWGSQDAAARLQRLANW